MRALLTSAALLLCICAAPADEPKPQLSLEATTFPGRGGFGPQMRVRLVSAGKDVSVVTEGLSTKVTKDDKKVTVTVTLPESKDDKGRLIVPSASKLGIVKLQPDEIAGLQVPTTMDLQQAVRAAHAGEVDLVIEYEISEAWGKRFGVTSGKIKGTATVAK